MITYKSFKKLSLEQQQKVVALNLKKANTKITRLKSKNIINYSPSFNILKQNIKKFNVKSNKIDFLYKQYKNLYNFNKAQTSKASGVGKLLQQAEDIGVSIDDFSYFWKVYHMYEEIYGINFSNFDSERAQKELAKVLKKNISLKKNVENFDKQLDKIGYFE